MSQQSQVRAFLRAATLTREQIDKFLDPHVPSWAKFDKELGYVPSDCKVPDNIDGALSEYRYGEHGERLLVNYADRPARINTYGDSFTQCHQVSDGETWQEVLAAHFGEPIRNFGVGGFGVYQAIARLRRTEATDAGVNFIILNIYLDDHYRSLDAYRLLRVGDWLRDYDETLSTSMFHANPWDHVRVDQATGDLNVHRNACPTPESLYQLCDTDFVVEQFADDFVVSKLVADQTGDYGYLQHYRQLADTLGVDLTAAPGREQAHELWQAAAFHVTRILLGELKSELESAGKQLLVLLTYPAEEVAEYLATGSRPDGQVLGDLSELGIPFVDGLALHAEDFADFRVSPQAYTSRYYAGHYTPFGNAAFAFMIKPHLVEWLDPEPPMYADAQKSFASFAERLA